MMTSNELRDKFAGEAMAALIAARCPDALLDVKQAAVYAYDYAEAMLNEQAVREMKLAKDSTNADDN